MLGKKFSLEGQLFRLWNFSWTSSGHDLTELWPGVGSGPVVVARLGTFKSPLQRAPALLIPQGRVPLSFPILHMLESEGGRS